MAFHKLFAFSDNLSLQGCVAIYILLVTCLTTPSLTHAAAAPDTITMAEIQKIETFAGDVMNCAKIAALSVGVVRGDATFATGLGIADMHTGHAAEKRTLFNIGATSKAFLPQLITELMNEPDYSDGRLAWYKTLGQLLKHPMDYNVTRAWASMTLRDMLVSRSGGTAADFSTMVGYPEHVTREGLVRRLQFLPNSPQFKKSDHYSNHLYTVISYVLEKMSGISWRELMKTRLFSKLGMTSATFTPAAMKMEDAALPYKFHSWNAEEAYQKLDKALFDIHPSDPVGSISVSAEDMTRWLHDVIRQFQGRGESSGINSPLKDAFDAWLPIPEDSKTEHMKHDSQKASGYGMGWLSSTYQGVRRYKFSGHLYSYSSHVWLFPEAKVGVYLAFNGPNTEQAQRALDGIMFQISDVLLRREPWVSSDIACCCQEEEGEEEEEYDYHYNDDDQPPPAEQRNLLYLTNPTNYTGKYGNNLIGMVDIYGTTAGVLYLRLGRNLEGELLPSETESALKLHTKGGLKLTAEWGIADKEIKFLYDTPGKTGVYDKVRITLTNGLSYDFVRGKPFQVMSLVEEYNEALDRMRAAYFKKDVSRVRWEESTDSSERYTRKEVVTVARVQTTTQTTTTTTTPTTTTTTPTTTTTTPTTTTTTPTTTTTTPTTTTTTPTTTTTTTTPTTTTTTTTPTTTTTTTTPTTTTTTTTPTTTTTTTTPTTTTTTTTPTTTTTTTTPVAATTEATPSKTAMEEGGKEVEDKSHEVLLQRDSDQNTPHNSQDGRDQSYMVNENKNKKFEGKSTRETKPDERSPSRGRLIRNHEDTDLPGNAARGFHNPSSIPVWWANLLVLVIVSLYGVVG